MYLYFVLGSKVVINDLTADGDGDLAGYWGGFSGDVDGTALGFLSPSFNGNNFHGKAVQVGRSSESVPKHAACFTGGFDNAYCICLCRACSY